MRLYYRILRGSGRKGGGANAAWRAKDGNRGACDASGQKLLLDVEEILQEKERVSCAIRKDSGDDPDITNGILIFASVEKAEDGFRLEGGTGVAESRSPGWISRWGRPPSTRCRGG